MPAITITLVTAATDTLTAVGHGLLTGDRFRLRNVGGALPASTPSLAGVTDYFAVRLDADNIKVAVSSANALAGTPVVDITGVGTGTHIIEYGLPYCIPNALAAAGTQIKSANDTGTWNSLVALYDLLTGQAQSVWSALILAVPFKRPGLKRPSLPELALPGTYSWVVGTGGITYVVSSGAGTSSFRLDVETGDVITGLVFAAMGDGTVDVTYNLLVISAAMVATNIGTITDSNRAASWGDVTMTVTPHTMADGECLALNATPNGANAALGVIRPVFG